MSATTIRRADFDAATFDIYGTVLQWEPKISAFFQRWADRHGLQVEDAEILGAYDRLRQPLQNQRPALRYPELLRRTFDGIAAEFGAAADADLREEFGKIAGTHEPFPDSNGALAALKARGFKLGALSNIDDRSFAEASARLDTAFDVVVTAQRVGAYKPDHAHFWAALSDMLALGVPPERVLHVAQSRRADIVPANALGLTCVWVNRPGHLFGRKGSGAEEARPDFEVGSLAELVESIV